jgi:hypothetical protein
MDERFSHRQSKWELRFSSPDSAISALTIRLLPDGKIVAKLGENTSHYTVQPGHNSGIVDLHETRELVPEGDPSRHKTLWRRSKTRIAEDFKSIGPQFVAELMDLLRPIRLGWIVRRNMAIGCRIPGEVELEGVNKISVRRVADSCPEAVPVCLRPPEFYEDVLRPPCGGYVLFKYDHCLYRPYGLMVTCLGQHGKVRMLWARLRDLRKLQTRWEPAMAATLFS